MKTENEEDYSGLIKALDNLENTMNEIECSLEFNRKKMEEHDRIWNTAIEAAAKVALENGEGCRWSIAEEIRKLKK